MVIKLNKYLGDCIGLTHFLTLPGLKSVEGTVGGEGRQWVTEKNNKDTEGRTRSRSACSQTARKTLNTVDDGK